MAQDEECLSLTEVKERQNKLDVRMNDHSERIAKIEVVINDVIVPELKEVKEIAKRSEQAISANAVKAAESTLQISNLASTMSGFINAQQKPSTALEIFKTVVSGFLTILFSGIVFLVATQTNLFK